MQGVKYSHKIGTFQAFCVACPDEIEQLLTTLGVTRFGFTSIEQPLAMQGRRLEVVFPRDTADDLVKDCVGISTSMAVRISGRRRSRSKVGQMKKCVEQVMKSEDTVSSSVLCPCSSYPGSSTFCRLIQNGEVNLFVQAYLHQWDTTMQITRGYRTELDLNNQQITACKQHAGVARFAWNWGLKRKQEVYKQTGHSIRAMDLHKDLNALKQSDFPWMYECSKAAPQESLRDLDKAFAHFFRRCALKKEGKWKGKLGYPRPKTKRRGLGSFRLTGSIHVYEKAIELPRLGRLRLKECGYLPTSSVKVLSATVSEEAGKWFVSLQVAEEMPDPPPATGEPIGVDTGIKTLAQCSDGRAVDNPKALRSELKHLRRLHRRLSRTEKGSKNRIKARKRLARKYARVAHVRWDALHKGTSLLTRATLSPEERASRKAEIAASLPEPKAKVKPKKGKRAKLSQPGEVPALSQKVAEQVKDKQIKRLLRQAQVADAPLRPAMVVLEDLNVAGMKRNRKLALAISDVGLGEFKRQMSYKHAWQGEHLLLADRFFPSTKKCSRCGHVKEDMDLAARIYVCDKPECGLVLDRDLNAALNLAALAREAQNPDPYRQFSGEGETPDGEGGSG